jgi:hypothetical protein
MSRLTREQAAPLNELVEQVLSHYVRGASPRAAGTEVLGEWLAAEVRPAVVKKVFTHLEDTLRVHVARGLRPEAIGAGLVQWICRSADEWSIKALCENPRLTPAAARVIAAALMAEVARGVQRDSAFDVADPMGWLAPLQRFPGAITPEDLAHLVGEATEGSPRTRSGYDARTVIADHLPGFRDLTAEQLERVWPFIQNRADKVGRLRFEDVEQVIGHASVSISLLRTIQQRFWIEPAQRRIAEHPAALSDPELRAGLLASRFPSVGALLAERVPESDFDAFLAEWLASGPQAALAVAAHLAERPERAARISEAQLAELLESESAEARLQAIRIAAHRGAALPPAYAAQAEAPRRPAPFRP